MVIEFPTSYQGNADILTHNNHYHNHTTTTTSTIFSVEPKQYPDNITATVHRVRSNDKPSSLWSADASKTPSSLPTFTESPT